ncbi:MAG: hypothetical protein IKI72_00025 [Bacteroidales bacterium]|nr:hypothetical protein [Bacteroidales bacterium]
MKTKIVYILLACLLAACSANPTADTPSTKSFTEPEKEWQAKIDATNDAAKAYLIEFGLGRESFYQVPDGFFTNQEDVLFKGTPIYVMDSVSSGLSPRKRNWHRC